jgi:peroxiredoxin
MLPIREGSKAPELTLHDEHCVPVRLPSAAGPVVVVFYRGDW